MKIPKDEEAEVDSFLLPVNGPNPVIHLYLHDESSCSPKIGLSATSSYQAHFLFSLDCKPVQLELVQGPDDKGNCGFREVDPRWMPGLYALQVPQAQRREGYTYVSISFSGTHPHYLELQGVNYDPYDFFSMGLETWIRSSCHENLSSGLRKSMPAVLRPLLAEWFANDEKVK